VTTTWSFVSCNACSNHRCDGSTTRTAVTATLSASKLRHVPASVEAAAASGPQPRCTSAACPSAWTASCIAASAQHPKGQQEGQEGFALAHHRDTTRHFGHTVPLGPPAPLHIAPCLPSAAHTPAAVERTARQRRVTQQCQR
jgi:hypothetical protein